MIERTRRELLDAIEELSAACPEYRLGQLILNLAFLAREDGDQALDVVRVAAVNDIEVLRRDRGAVEHGCGAPDDDEGDTAAVKHFEQRLEISGLGV